jgi:Fe-S-cluster containining protein
MSRNSECFCGSGRKTKKCHPDIHPESKVALALKNYKKIHDTVESYRNTHQVNSPCKMGCAECCYDKFFITNAEFEMILKELKNSWSEQEIENLFDTSLNNLELLKKIDYNLFEILEGDGNSDTSLYFIQIFSESKKLFPCVFLDENTNSCKIYNFRPLVCRAHGSTHDSKHLSHDAPICGHISSSLKNAEITPDIGDILSDTDRILHVQIENKHIRIREYPIFYWFVVYFRNNGGRKEVTLAEEENYFKVPKKIGDLQQAQRYMQTRLL